MIDLPKSFGIHLTALLERQDLHLKGGLMLGKIFVDCINNMV